MSVLLSVLHRLHWPNSYIIMLVVTSHPRQAVRLSRFILWIALQPDARYPCSLDGDADEWLLR